MNTARTVDEKGVIINQKNIKDYENSQEESRLICGMCMKHDDFSLCSRCFQIFNEKSIYYKKLTSTDNMELKKSVQEFFDSRKIQIEKYNRICSKQSNIENLKRLIKLTSLRNENLKENINNIIKENKNAEEKIENIEKNINEINNLIFLNRKNNLNLSENIHKKNSEKNIMIKNYLQKLLRIIFDGNIFLFSEIFEKDEYVLPSIEKDDKKKRYFDDLPNVLSTEAKKFEKNSIEDLKKHHFEKYLKTKEYIINFNMNPFPYSKNNNLKAQEKDIYNKCFIYEINNYVHKIMLFTKILAKFLNVKLPYNIENEYNMEIMDNFEFISEIKKLTIPDSNLNFNESEIFSGFCSLDKNLIFLKDILGIKSKLTKHNFFHSRNYQNNLQYFNSMGNIDVEYPPNFSFSTTNLGANNNKSHQKANSKIENLSNGNCGEFNTDFLNVVQFFSFCGENYKMAKFSRLSEEISIESSFNRIGISEKEEIRNNHAKSISFFNESVNIIEDCRDEEIGGFVLIDNYFGGKELKK